MKTKGTIKAGGCACGGGKMMDGGMARKKLMRGGKAGKCGCGGKMKKQQGGITPKNVQHRIISPYKSQSMLDIVRKKLDKQSEDVSKKRDSIIKTREDQKRKKLMGYEKSEAEYRRKNNMINIDSTLQKGGKTKKAQAGGLTAPSKIAKKLSAPSGVQEAFADSANAYAKKDMMPNKLKANAYSKGFKGVAKTGKYEIGGLLNLRVNRAYVAEDGRVNGYPAFRAVGKYRNGGMIGRLVTELRRVYTDEAGFVVNGVKY